MTKRNDALQDEMNRLPRLLGKSLRAIAAELNEQGTPTPRGGQWYASNVREILLNKADYRGGKRGESNVRWPKVLR